MIITLGRAAAWFEWRAKNTPMAGAREIFKMAAAALREKAERDAPIPLTLEELWQMNGEPVWMVWPDKRIKAKWWIVGNHEWILMEFDDPIMAKRYGSVWVAYRHEPKEVA